MTFIRRTVLIILLLAAGVLVAGCTENNADTAVAYLQSLSAGEAEAASDFVCTERADEIASAMITTPENSSVQFENISCSQRGAEVACRFTVTQQSNTLDPAQQFDRQVVFQIEDGLICGFEEEVAN